MQERGQLGWHASWGKTGPPACRERELTGKEHKSGTCHTRGKVKAHGPLHARHQCMDTSEESKSSPCLTWALGTTNHLNFQRPACPSKQRAGVGIVRASSELNNTWVSICRRWANATHSLLFCWFTQHSVAVRRITWDQWQWVKRGFKVSVRMSVVRIYKNTLVQ